jgi:hypothetical protein
LALQYQILESKFSTTLQRKETVCFHCKQPFKSKVLVRGKERVLKYRP